MKRCRAYCARLLVACGNAAGAISSHTRESYHQYPPSFLSKRPSSAHHGVVFPSQGGQASPLASSFGNRKSSASTEDKSVAAYLTRRTEKRQLAIAPSTKYIGWVLFCLTKIQQPLSPIFLRNTSISEALVLLWPLTVCSTSGQESNLPTPM